MTLGLPTIDSFIDSFQEVFVSRAIGDWKVHPCHFAFKEMVAASTLKRCPVKSTSLVHLPAR